MNTRLGVVLLTGWVIMLPPMTHKPHCKTVYEENAPIEKWKRTLGPFDTMDKCEWIRAEYARRQANPQRTRRAYAYVSERERKDRRYDRELRKRLKHDPELKSLNLSPEERVWLLEHPEDKAFILKQLKNDPQQNAFELCEAVADYWSHARCAEVKEQEHP